MPKTVKVNFWIWKKNIIPGLLLLSHIAEYPDFSNDDYEAILFGLSNTDKEEDKWFEYNLYGSKTLKLQLCNEEPGASDVIFLRIEIEEGSLKELNLCHYILTEFDIENRYFKNKIYFEG